MLGHVRVTLPDRTLLFSWCHPWVKGETLGLPGLQKITKLIIAELLHEGNRAAGIKPKIRHVGYTEIKWPLYSLDGTTSHTVTFAPTRKAQRTHVRVPSRSDARRATLVELLGKLSFSRWERSQIWAAYNKKFHPDYPPPTVPRVRGLLPPSSVEAVGEASRPSVAIVTPRGAPHVTRVPITFGRERPTGIISKEVTPAFGRVLPFRQIYH